MTSANQHRSAMKLHLSTLPALVFSATLTHAEKPNVLLFFIDDLGYTDLGVNGSTFYKTPNLDKLAKAGANFTNAYSAHPVCSPTRAALMSGKAPQRVGITQWISGGTGIHLAPEEVTIGEAMKAGGYATAYIGKWHLGEADAHQPDKQGFDWIRGVNRAGQPASYFFPYQKKRKNGAADVPDLEDGKQGDYLTDVLTDRRSNLSTHRETNPSSFALPTTSCTRQSRHR